ncbi:MAG: riboflavin synthase [Planctomycetes bacterium]|nr:riboflavin synthase [Planctomycetota bacterium]
MFTGIIQTTGRVSRLAPLGAGIRLALETRELAPGLRVGDSVCVAGCCLTVVETDGSRIGFDMGEETIGRTTLGRRRIGDRINLESSLRAGDPLGGHFVTGHIDGVGRLARRDDHGDWSDCWFSASPALLRQMASKGSVAVDGVSLTLVEVGSDRFSVALIPHTLAVTTLGELRVGDEVNLETDVLAKYIERQLGLRDSVPVPPSGSPS